MPSILVVDDDKDILKIAQKVLSTGPYNVRVAADAMTALDLLANNFFDAVISDASMPHYSGFDLIKTIRKDEKFEHVAIAMLTARREKHDIEKAIRLGIDDYIIKPIDPLLFLKKVDNLLAKRKQALQPEVWLPQTQANSTATVMQDVQMIAISEEGLVAHSKFQLPEGEVLTLKSPLLEELGIETTQLRVYSSLRQDDGTWESRLLFFAVHELTLQKIRSWMITHASQAVRRRQA